MSIKLHKPQLKAFKLIAAQLPSLNVASSELHLMTGEEILALQTIDEIDGKPIDPERKYWLRLPVLMFANHNRRLKRAYYRGGPEAVQKYIETVVRIAKEYKEEFVDA